MVVDALKAHRAARSRKPLIMSLHGDIGTGKTALSMLLARAMFGYKEGEEYGASGVYIIDKPFGATDEEYRDFIRKTLGGALRSGRGSLFVFERMDDVPGNITNLLKKQLEARGQKHCKNEAIFLLNTHIGSEELDRLAITSWLDGVDRDHITRVKLQAAITAASGDTSDPLAHRWHRRMVEHGLITESVPFLPLDRSIVRRCLIRQMTYIAFYDEERRSADLHKAMSDLAFYPYQHQVFAKNGCANISQTLK